MYEGQEVWQINTLQWQRNGSLSHLSLIALPRALSLLPSPSSRCRRYRACPPPEGLSQGAARYPSWGRTLALAAVSQSSLGTKRASSTGKRETHLAPSDWFICGSLIHAVNTLLWSLLSCFQQLWLSQININDLTFAVLSSWIFF
jgi:hypothetical protein